MAKVSRRAALGVIGLGAAGAVAAYRLQQEPEIPSRPAPRTGTNPVTAENRLPGGDWTLGGKKFSGVTDMSREIQGYASRSSVAHGETLDFHISVRTPQPYTVSVYRIGHYGGAGARHIVTSPKLQGMPRDVPRVDPETGAIDCGWPVTWRLEIPRDWVSGIFLAVFTSDDGHRSYTPFVVRDAARRCDVLVVLPFTTYQAYNIWPLDGRTGKNLYKGYRGDGRIGGNAERAFKVSFDRPYAQLGLPRWFDMDTSFARWAEEAGYDVTYASGVDLHEGRVDPAKYTAMVFSGHDEYWSRAMRDVVEEAIRVGTHLAFLASNNLYFHIRLEDSSQGTAHRVVTCYKEEPDPEAGDAGRTIRWRHVRKRHAAAEQGLLGVQYNGMLKQPVPLVVQEAKHWFWAGTGLRDGDEIPDLVAVEADGFDPSMPRPEDSEQTLLSASPSWTGSAGSRQWRSPVVRRSNAPRTSSTMSARTTTAVSSARRRSRAMSPRPTGSTERGAATTSSPPRRLRISTSTAEAFRPRTRTAR